MAEPLWILLLATRQSQSWQPSITVNMHMCAIMEQGTQYVSLEGRIHPCSVALAALTSWLPSAPSALQDASSEDAHRGLLPS